MSTTKLRQAVVRRIVAAGVWESTSPVHLGGDAQFESNADMAIARDQRGRFYIPGASLAGAARSYLARAAAQSHSDYAQGNEEKALFALFGRKMREKDKKEAAYASLVTFDEGQWLSSAGLYVRDGVKIDPKSGNATKKGKYNLEVLPAGTRFQLRLQLALYSQLPHDVASDEALKWFRWILDSFGPNGVKLGGKTRKGFGDGHVAEWDIREFDFSDRAHALDWLRAKGAPGGRKLQADELAKAPLPEVRYRLTINASFRIRTSLLVRGPSGEINSPDATHFTENKKKLLPGTSLGGVFRHRLEMIANTLGMDGVKVGRSLFGTANEVGFDDAGGRVYFKESLLEQGNTRVQSRVSIDRFSGGAQESRLFDEAPYWGGTAMGPHLKTAIVIDNPKPLERRLLFAAFRDLWLGDIPVGGESGIGRGIVEGLEARFQEYGRADMTWRCDAGVPDTVVIEGAAAWADDLGEVANV